MDSEDTIPQQPTWKSESLKEYDHAVLETLEQLKVKTEQLVSSCVESLDSTANTPTNELTMQLNNSRKSRSVENDGQDADSLCELVIAECDDSPMPAIEQMVENSNEKDPREEEQPPKLEEPQRETPSTQPGGTESCKTQLTVQKIGVEKEQQSNTTAEGGVAATKLGCKPMEKSSNPFILPKPSTELTVEKVPSLLPLSITPSQHNPAGIVINQGKVLAKKAKAVVSNANKPIAKKAIKPKLSPPKSGETSSKKKAPPTMIVNPMDCMTTSLAAAKALPKPRKKPTVKQKKANEKANCGNNQQSPEQKSSNSSPSSGNGNNNNLMMATGMQNMIFQNQLALAPNGNLIAMPSYMQMPSSQPNGQPQFIPVMSSQIYLAMQQQQQQQSENNFAQASSSNPSVGSKIPGMPMMQSNVNSAMNAGSSIASSVVQPAQLMSTSGAGNQMFFRLTPKASMFMPTLVTPQNMAPSRSACSTTMQFNPASGALFSQPQQQQQKFIQPKQVSSTASSAQVSCRLAVSNEKLQKTPPSNATASQLAKQQIVPPSSSTQLFGQQPVFSAQPHQSQQFADLSNSRLAASLQGSSTMPRLVQITPSPISGSSLNNMSNQQHQLQSAWGIANFSMASSNPPCSSTQAVMPCLSTTSIFPQMPTTSDGMDGDEQQLPAPAQKARRKRKTGTGGQEEEAPSREANDEEENEPPPLLCRDEFGKIENVFLREAALMHERCFDAHGNKKSPIKHVIGDFVIEEDLEPFPCEHKQLLDGLTSYESVDEEEENESREHMENDLPSISRRPPPPADADNEANDGDDSDEKSYCIEKRKKMRKKKSGLEVDRRVSDQHPSPTLRAKKRTISSSSSRAATPVASKKPTASTPEKKARRRREVENLLTMDFGPGKTPFQTTSVDEYTDEIMVEAQQQQRNMPICDERMARQSSESSQLNLPVPSTVSIPKLPKEKEPKSVGRLFRIHSDESATEEMATSKPSSSSAIHKKTAQPMESRPEAMTTGQPNYETQQLDEQAMLWGDERCIYCKTMFRELGKRHQENPQYCSKTCRRKFKKQKSANGLSAPGSSTDNPSRGRINIDSLAERHNISAPKIVAHGSSAFSATTGSPTSLKIKLRSPTEECTGELLEVQQALHGRKNSFLRSTTNTAELRDGSSPEVISYSCGVASTAVTGSGLSGGNGLVSYVHSHLHPQHFASHHQMMPVVDWQASKHSATPSSLTSHHPPLYHFASHPSALTPESVHYLQRDSPAPSSSMAFAMSSLTTSPAPSSATPMSVERTNELEMLMARGVQSWGPMDVARWVNIVTNSETNGERFLQEQVDGVALCYLTLPNLQNELNFKLGPAVKLFNSINALRAVTSAAGVSLGE